MSWALQGQGAPLQRPADPALQALALRSAAVPPPLREHGEIPEFVGIIAVRGLSKFVCGVALQEGGLWSSREREEAPRRAVQGPSIPAPRRTCDCAQAHLRLGAGAGPGAPRLIDAGGTRWAEERGGRSRRIGDASPQWSTWRRACATVPRAVQPGTAEARASCCARASSSCSRARQISSS